LRWECRLRVFENRELRRIFGPIRDEVTGVWRRLYNITYRALVRKREGRRPLERPRRRWEDTIKMDLREVGRGE
jgi:hypothetical protein